MVSQTAQYFRNRLVPEPWSFSLLMRNFNPRWIQLISGPERSRKSQCHPPESGFLLCPGCHIPAYVCPALSASLNHIAQKQQSHLRTALVCLKLFFYPQPVISFRGEFYSTQSDISHEDRSSIDCQMWA